MTSNSHIVSVITRTKDRPNTLRRTLKSLMAQSCKRFEWVIVNDAGEAKPVEAIAQEARTHGIRTNVVNKQTSAGMEAASNTGIATAGGDYILILDDDDTIEPDCIGEMAAVLERDSRYLGVVCHTKETYERQDEDGFETEATGYLNPLLSTLNIPELLERNLFTTNAFLFRKEVWKAIGGYDESLPVLGDWDFNIRALLHGDIAVLPKPLANYHIRRNQDKESTYANTIIAGRQRHIEYTAIVRNRWLRKGLHTPDNGVGILLAIGHERDKSAQMARVKDTAKDLVNLVVADKKRRCVVYGSGELGQAVIAYLIAQGIEVPGAVDGSRSLQGSTILDTPVLSPDALRTLDPDSIVIASRDYASEIHQTIASKYADASNRPTVYAPSFAVRLPFPN